MNPAHEEWLKLVTRPSEILLVEDDALFGEMMQEVMDGYLCKLTIANSGERAIELLKSGTFDLVILDYKLPGMNGYDMLKHINTFHADTPVIILSGNLTTEMILQISSLGLVAFVYKPTTGTIFQLRRLLKILGIKPIHPPVPR